LKKRTIIAVISDTHGGSRLALMNPTVELYHENEEGELIPYVPTPTKSQEYLWGVYVDNIASVMALAGDDEVIVIHNGDLTMGNKHSNLLVSDRLSDQILIAVANLSPWLECPNVKSMQITMGTAAHNFGEGSGDLLVTQILGFKYPGKSIRAMYHGLFSCRGKRLDVAHHGPGVGSREWLKGNVARFYARDIILGCLANGHPIPDMILRGHVHEFIDEEVPLGVHKTRMVITPSYSMLGDYATQVTRSKSILQHGCVALDIQLNKPIQVIPLLRTLDIRTQEEL
jgi:hypothetical protein